MRLFEIKMNLLKDMYNLVGQDELAYEEWIAVFPDEPTQDDLKEIVENENEWVIACELLNHLIKEYKLS